MYLALTMLLLLQGDPVAKAEKILAKSPDDPAANLVMAAHHASLAEWDLAIPRFEKAKSPEIRAAVDAEKKAEGNVEVDLGDAWTRAMGKAGGARQACLDRASFWYAKAWPKLDAFGKSQLRERTAKLYRPAAPRQGVMPEKWGGPVDPAHKVEVMSPVVHEGGAALKLSPGAKAKNASFLRSQTLPLPKGKVVEFSAWVYSDGTDSLDDAIRLSVADAAAKPILTKAIAIPTDTPVWTRLSERVDLGDAPGRSNVEVVIFSTKGFVVVDDLSIRVDGKEVLKGGNFE